MSDSQSLAEKGVNFISQKREDTEWEMASENVLGRGVLAYQGLNEAQKYSSWIGEGGKGFKGEFGEVRRYITGLSEAAAEHVSDEGFKLNVKRNFVANLPGSGWMFSRAGKGVYATTNPTLAMENYGPVGAVVDIAMGRELRADQNFIVQLADQIKDPATLAVIGYSLFLNYSLYIAGQPPGLKDILGLAGIGYMMNQGKVLEALGRFKEYDSIRVTPNAFSTFLRQLNSKKALLNPLMLLNSNKRHASWVIARDPARVKVVGFIKNPQEALQYTKGLDNKFK